VLVKRVAKYEVIADGNPTVVTVPSPEMQFRRTLLRTSTIAHVIVTKFGLDVRHMVSSRISLTRAYRWLAERCAATWSMSVTRSAP
jgi:hypothetical protein